MTLLNLSHHVNKTTESSILLNVRCTLYG